MAAIIKQQFLQKRKDANLILVLQVIALIFIAILTLFSRDEHQIYSSYFMSSEYYWEVIFQTAVGITLLMDIVYAVLSSYRNEKINLSQTWNLIPVSNAKLWLSNII
ncbi:hypothetical protein EJK17_00105 [Lactobacillus xujianguonis]|uniref:ABC transporter permease n=1 Tax=Lactobacillus xujianguonis TaxID=2495899 RepID=A0A437SXS2_9LACO|nr:hypothetical protein [Lactobacillus xujianguonis]RVU71716.1 hypothetical protein EJK17_00105 [Lactobacillus xujianguonis]RVU77546.1 hypothetical protein EJK20_00940 [Lactobacillus xujianguonis]